MRARTMILGLSALILSSSGAAFGQGFVLPGVGPVNRSMGGASTAAPIDATGSLHWNPATISGLPGSRFDLGVDLVVNRNQVDSGVGIGTPGEISGSTDNDAGVYALPAIGLVYQPDGSRFSYGLGLNVIGGFFVNYPGSVTNPIFTPQPPVGAGFGPSYTRLGFIQIAPTLAYEITETLSVGIAPTINVADAQASPFPFAAPNADGSFSGATGNRNVWGIGVQAGVFYESPAGVNLGFSIKSPQWFDRFEFNSEDELGLPRTISTQLEYPMILSLGAAYTGIEHVLIAADVRWVDYGSTEAFGEPATMTASGALRGLGWESVWIVALGVQVEVTDRLTFRAGYSYNENPIPEFLTTFNVLAPAVYQHVLNLGASYQLSESVIMSLTWAHGFDNTVTGPLLTPAGPAPLSRVNLNQEVDSIIAGLSILF